MYYFFDISNKQQTQLFKTTRSLVTCSVSQIYKCVTDICWQQFTPRLYLFSKNLPFICNIHIQTQKRHYTSSIFAAAKLFLEIWFVFFIWRTFFGLSHLVPYLFLNQTDLHLYFLSSHWTIYFPLLSLLPFKILIFLRCRTTFNFRELPSFLDYIQLSLM